MTMNIFLRVILGVCITIAVLLVIGVVLMYTLFTYFPEGLAPYREEFMDLDEVKALHRAYPTAGPDYGSSSRLMYTAISEDRSRWIDLEVLHKPHSFEVIGMRLACWGDGNTPVWSVEEDILHHIESRRCF